MVLEAGAVPFIADSPALNAFKRVAARTGMAAVAEELGIELLELTHPVPVATAGTSLFRQLEIASQAVQADVIINLPKLKTHCHMLLTLGVKNLFGTVVAQRKAEWHHMTGVDRDVFAALHLDICQTLKPALTILDGVWGMEGHGPSNGRPRQLNLLAASADALALDLAVCRVLGVPLRSFPLYRVARARDGRAADPDRIDLLGDPAGVFAAPRFQVPELDSVGMLPASFDGFTKRFLVSKPVRRPEVCTACGQCGEICPADAIQMSGRRIRFDYDRCIRCYCCQEVCPQDGIGFRRGLLVRVLNRLKR